MIPAKRRQYARIPPTKDPLIGLLLTNVVNAETVIAGFCERVKVGTTNGRKKDAPGVGG
jgi:hypothetical protein